MCFAPVQLEQAIADLTMEFDACTALRGSLEERLQTVISKLDLNRSRLQVSDPCEAIMSLAHHLLSTPPLG
jgi:hypothetical protein